jgi:hypothetical protein
MVGGTGEAGGLRMRGGLRVVPAGRTGPGTLHVSGPDGRARAWYDRGSGHISLLSAADEEAVVSALRPFLSGSWTIGPPPVPGRAELRRLALHPDDDLAPNRPGERLLGELEHGGAGTRSRLRSRAALLARQRFGTELDTLEGAGWRVLHDVPLPAAAAIDHLLIGPGGLYAVHTAAGRRQRASVGDLLLKVGRAEPVPAVRWCRRAADLATHALGFPVTPALAVVDAARLTVAPTLRDVHVLREGATAHLSTLAGILKPTDTDSLHTTARDRRTWWGAG